MKYITDIVLENKKEAYDLLKKAGGRIDFAVGLDEYENFDDVGDSPSVILDGESIVDGLALAVRVGVEPNTIDFLAYDLDLEDNIGWLMTDRCLSNSENEIYLAIEGWCKGHGII